MRLIKKYWPEFIVFTVVLAVLLIDLNPDFTFVNKAADSMGYIYSAKYLYPSYHTSPPLYLLLSHFFLMIPLGTDAWRMGLVSVLSTFGACIFIYLIIRQYTNKWYALLGILMYGLGAIVLSQSIIVNTYALICFLAVGALYFALNHKFIWASLFLGAGLAVHVLMGFVWLIFICSFRDYRRNWKCWIITLAFGVFYLYIPLTNREPYMWLPDTQSVNPVWAFVSDTISTINFLIGTISIWDVPKRIFDTLGIVGVSFGVLAIVPIVYYFINNRFKVLFWLSIVPILIFISELDMNTYDYTMLAMPFLTIVAMCGLYELNQAKAWGKIVTIGVAVTVFGFGIFNANYFDIGRTLDKNLGATELYRTEFEKIPDGAVFMPNYGWNWEAIYLYNADQDKHIFPICIELLPSKLYQSDLVKHGIKFNVSKATSETEVSQDIAKSIVMLNDNVYTTVSTDDATMSVKVVNWGHDTSLLAATPQVELDRIAANPQWKFIPYNPYNIITTAICVSDWKNVIFSNYNLFFFCELASIGLILYWFIYIRPERKRKQRENTLSKQ